MGAVTATGSLVSESLQVAYFVLNMKNNAMTQVEMFPHKASELYSHYVQLPSSLTDSLREIRITGDQVKLYHELNISTALSIDGNVCRMYTIQQIHHKGLVIVRRFNAEMLCMMHLG